MHCSTMVLHILDGDLEASVAVHAQHSLLRQYLTPLGFCTCLVATMLLVPKVRYSTMVLHTVDHDLGASVTVHAQHSLLRNYGNP